MKPRPWLAKLGARDEKIRAAHGLIPKRDGWYKSIDGRTRYVCKPCPLTDVLKVLDARVEAIKARHERRVQILPGVIQFNDLAEAYLTWLRQRLTTGYPKKLSRRTYDDNVAVLDEFVETIGPTEFAEQLGPADFSRYAVKHLAGRAPSTIRRRMIYVDAFAAWAVKAGHLTRPWKFGPDWRKPSDSEITTSAADSDKAYSPAQLRDAFRRVRKLPLLRAAGYLGLCCAFSPKDVAHLPESAVDLATGFVTFPRGKTGVARLCWLTPRARVVLRRYLMQRPDACGPTAKGLFFRTANGLPYYRDAADDSGSNRFDGIGNRWSKLVGLPFSGLRSTFATRADAEADHRAIDTVMGHVSRQSIRSRHYAKRIDPQRIESLTRRVVAWALKLVG